MPPQGSWAWGYCNPWDQTLEERANGVSDGADTALWRRTGCGGTGELGDFVGSTRCGTRQRVASVNVRVGGGRTGFGWAGTMARGVDEVRLGWRAPDVGDYRRVAGGRAGTRGAAGGRGSSGFRGADLRGAGAVRSSPAQVGVPCEGGRLGGQSG